MKTLTFRKALIWGSLVLKRSAVPEPVLSARLLLQHATYRSHSGLLLLYNKPILPQILAYYRFLINRRKRFEPLPYILGYHYFMDFTLEIRRGVFIPRPETEILVEVAIKKLRDKKGIVIDMGTGTGAIAIALARFCPGLSLIGIDISREAIALARRNARLNGVGSRIIFRRADISNAELPQAVAIISNPPYIPTYQLPRLPLQIRLYEPMEALDGGEDGLEIIRLIVSRAREILLPGGYLILEVGEGQSERVKEIFIQNGFEDVEVFKDLLKIERIVSGVRYEG